METENMFYRNCPICNKETSYNTKEKRDKAEKEKKICRSCIQRECWKTRDNTKIIEMNKSRKGKTIEEIHGTEKGKKIKEKISKTTKGVSYEEKYGDRAQEEIEKRYKARETLIKQRKGKTFEEIYGEEKGKELRINLSKNSYFNLNSPMKGKKYIDVFGEEKTKDIINRRIKHFQGKTYEELYGEEKAKIMKSNSSKRLKGKTFNDIYGPVRSKEIRDKISKYRLSETAPYFCPNFNKKACEIFNLLNSITGINGVHALNFKEYHIKELNYFVDFYEPTLNLVIEWDEKHHKKQIEKDKIRENRIINLLDCTFVRIDETEIDFTNKDKIIQTLVEKITSSVVMKALSR